MSTRDGRACETAAAPQFWQALMLCVCVAFGLAMVANTQTANDGGWLWYAIFLQQGKRLYADLHLALQPLFVLETDWFLRLLGRSWLATKIPAVLHIVAYALGLAAVVRPAKLSDWQKALVLGCAFFVTVSFAGYRFDDYHVVADCFQVWSLVVLLRLDRAVDRWRGVWMAAGLGVLSGLSLMTRLNDGAALFLGVGIALVALAPRRKIISLAAFSLSGLLTVLAVVGLTGDSLRDYASYSIFKAAGSKGGAGSVLVHPLQLPWNTVKFIADKPHRDLLVYILGSAAIWVFLIRPFLRTRRAVDFLKLLVGVAMVLLPVHRFHPDLLDAEMMMGLGAVGVLVLYGLGAAVFARFLLHATGQNFPGWNALELLLLIPLGQLASGSMSSGGSPLGLYAPIAIMILLLPLATPIRPRWEPARAFLVAILVLLTIHCASYKYRFPYIWHSYGAERMFVGRQWYSHPIYGPMVIDQDTLNFIQPVCAMVAADGNKELLSMPFSYANYFCGIEPWHGYVQTFYDTSTKGTIDGLMQELSSPPKWILYQRQLANLAMHEQLFNQGRPLPHRYLDQMIEAKIADGEWKTISTSTYGSRGFYVNEWLLIQTRP